ncbi:MAG: hypothetical protein IKP40_11650 [Clostridia bacterium]|nr:hypothetical protein [Clostridia bacterium]
MIHRALCLPLDGAWRCRIPGREAEIPLPGTLDQAGLGQPDDPLRQWKREEVAALGFWREGDPIVTRLTRRFTYEGPAAFSRELRWIPPENKRLFFLCERARHLRLRVNGQEVPALSGTLSTPWVFEVTGLMTGADGIEIISDNSMPGWPRDAIVYSSAASDETQTNWNGLLGVIGLRAEEPVFLTDVRALPAKNRLRVLFTVDAPEGWKGRVRLKTDAVDGDAELEVDAPAGRSEWRFPDLPVRADAARWDIGEGVAHRLTLSADGLEDAQARFGLRTFEAADGVLRLNGRTIFLRGEANCCVFPETGYAPMDEAAWREALSAYTAYGVNCLRFHSHCPPEAAFAAADDLGLLLQPECSHWDPAHAFAAPEARAYYRRELLEILRCLANHPSFVMLTLGNELQADEEGHRFMAELLAEARVCDPTRLYANGSNPHYGALGTDPSSDFYTASDWRGQPLRATSCGPTGWLNGDGPAFDTDYREALSALRGESGQPVFGFEVGQYESLPDFSEIADFRGVTRPDNLSHMRERVRQAGLEGEWPRRVEASGELALLCYRAEVEAALRTPGFSGLSLLGLQDFPGQGTALVGMMNSHMKPKPFAFARPERFAAFFRDALPLALLPRLTFTEGETLQADLLMANFSREALTGTPAFTLTGGGQRLSGTLDGPVTAPRGERTPIGTLQLKLTDFRTPCRLELLLSFAGCENRYDLWVYPEEAPVCPPEVHECRALDEEAIGVLRQGGKVFLAPDSAADWPGAVQPQFSTDFWSVCTFPDQAGCMGQLIEADHPALAGFPTESHTDWQWRSLACEPAIPLPEGAKSIVTVMDSCARLRALTQLCEGRCLGGSLLVSTLGLRRLPGPEARALLRSLYAYMASQAFQPGNEMSAP